MNNNIASLSSQKISTSLGTIHIQTNFIGSVKNSTNNKEALPAIVCWPSLMMTGIMWKGQLDYFGSEYPMILIDSPGHGESQPLDSVFNMEDCAKCLTEILDALEVSECILVGNSWGGMMGGVFAALYPERTYAAILMNCTASPASTKQKLEYTATVALLRQLKSYPDLLINKSVKAFAGKTTENNKPDVVEFIKETVKKANPKSVSWAIESVVPLRKDQHSKLNTITKPVLVMTGEEDRTFPVKETKAMADSIPNAVFKVLPNVGHLAALEAPQQVNETIEEFLVSLKST